MCGIAGWIDYETDVGENASILNRMSNSLARRGPDTKGFHKERHACLLHRRLIVIDPKNGNQPMRIAYNDEDYTLVYNGELYNTDEIRKELLSLGYTFKGHSDTEVLLVSFIHWREKCVEKFNGIFAFAVWDTKEQTLFFARDRIGVKPLFFYNYEKGLIFASEIKTLLCNPKVTPGIDEEGLMEIFFIGPGRTPGNGVIKGIKELLPGEYAYFSKDNGLVRKKYWALKARPFEDNFNEITVKKAGDFYIETFDIIESGSKTHITNEDESESGTITCTISFGVRWDSESDDYQEFLEKEEITNGEVFKNKITVTVTQSGE